MARADTYAVIMAGGSGTRFWPASREMRPKQLLPLTGGGRESLLAATLRRLAPVVPAARTYVVTASRLEKATRAEVPAIAADRVLAEPVPRNTAAAIGWAASVIARRDPNAVVSVFPSDHHVQHEETFRFLVTRALDAARQGYLATVGVVPTRPETGYGYIQRGAELAAGVFRAARFVEKPVRPVAEQYVAGGQHVWNAGMFFFQAKVMLDALRTYLPELAQGLAEIDAAAAEGGEASEAAAVARIFPALPSISIDHGVMEKAENVAVLPGDFGWNDVGSWQSAYELSPKDGAGNAVPEGTVARESSGNYVRDLTTTGSKRRYALVGVSDLIVVETDDAVLVLPRDRAQDVRAVVEELKRRGETDWL